MSEQVFDPNREAMNILAIDPGTTESGAVIFDTTSNRVAFYWPCIDNHKLLDLIVQGTPTYFDEAAIEMVASYGMPVGKEVFETCVWIGRFLQVIGQHRTTLIYRRDVKLNICGQVRAKDGNVAQAIKDRFGGKAATGTKKNPGPLYGVSKHAWAALAVALTRADHLAALREQ